MKFVSLQVLRAIAALAVVLHHAQGLCQKYAHGLSVSEAAMQGVGRYGVDLFFVLSGFVILHSINSSNTDAREFLVRRLVRIVPIYWVLTLLFVGITIALPMVISNHQSPSVTPIVKSLFFVQYASNTGNPILFVGWSVEYEMYFYLLTAIVLALRLDVYRYLAIALIGLYVSVNLLVADAGTDGSIWFFIGNQLTLEFLAGGYLAQLLVSRRMALADAAIGVVALLAVALIDGGGRLFFAGLPAVALVWIAIKTENVFVQSSVARAVAKVGDASYSIYLVQVMSLPFVGKLFQRLAPQLPPDVLVVVGTVFTLIFGIVVYRLIERPMLHYLRLPALRTQRA